MREPLDDFDQIERVTRRIGRAALVGVPVLVVLLAVLPFTGLGVLACLSLAVLLSVVAVVLAERRRIARAERAASPPDATARGERAPMSALAGAGIALGVVVVLVYVVFVVRAA